MCVMNYYYILVMLIIILIFILFSLKHHIVNEKYKFYMHLPRIIYVNVMLDEAALEEIYCNEPLYKAAELLLLNITEAVAT